MDKATKRLFEAAKTGNVADAQAALDAGADVNAKSEWQDTPLHYAALRQSTNIARLLIDNGADVNAKNDLQETPLHWAVTDGPTATARLLIENGADINARDGSQETPLDAAARDGHTDIVELLENAAKQQQGHADRVTKDRKDKGPPRIG